jgi:hypothetical protein
VNRISCIYARYPRACLWGFAVAIVFLIFPDVILLGASFRPSDLYNEFGHASSETSSWFPDPAYRSPRDGYADLPAALLQHEPVLPYMRAVLRGGESPFWNPYQAAGTAGFETMVDGKSSPVTLLIAALGGGSLAYHGAWLLFCALSLYCLLRVFSAHLELSPSAAAVGALAFMMNGFMTSNLSTQMAHPYLLSPILLYALVRLADRPDAARVFVAMMAEALLMLTLFAPVLLVAFTASHAIALAYLAGGRGFNRSLTRPMISTGLAAVGGFLLVAPVWLPILEFLRGHNLYERYDQVAHVYAPLPLEALLSLFTPKHVWESYNASSKAHFSGEVRAFFLEAKLIHHVGIAIAFPALFALGHQNRLHRAVSMGCALLLLAGLGRAFGVFPFSLISHLPAYRIVGTIYWSGLWMLAWAFLAALGFQRLSPETAGAKRLWAFAIALLALLALILRRTGLPDAPFAGTRLAAFGLVLVGVLGLLFLMRRFPGRAAWCKVGLIGLIFLELTFYTNHLRPQRAELGPAPSDAIAFVREHRADIHERVLHIGRNDLEACWGTAFAIPQVCDLTSSSMPPFQRFFYEYLSDEQGKGERFLSFGPVRTSDPPRVNARALDLLGVRYIMVNTHRDQYTNHFTQLDYRETFRDGPEKKWDARKVIFENTDVFPRAFVVHALAPGMARLEEGAPSLRDVAYSRDETLLARAKVVGIPAVPVQPPPVSSPVEFLHYGHASVSLKVRLKAPGVVFLSDSFHPNWTAVANGESVLLSRVNDAFRGIVLPAGAHTIQMTYRPRTLSAGLGLSVATLLLALTSIACRHRRISIPVHRL